MFQMILFTVLIAILVAVFVFLYRDMGRKYEKQRFELSTELAEFTARLAATSAELAKKSEALTIVETRWSGLNLPEKEALIQQQGHELKKVSETLAANLADLGHLESQLDQTSSELAELKQAWIQKENQFLMLSETLARTETALAQEKESAVQKWQLLNEAKEVLALQTQEKEAQFAKQMQLRMAELSELKQALTQKDNQVLILSETLARTETALQQEKDSAQEKLNLLNEAKEVLALQFKNSAAEILKENSQQFVIKNQESMTGLLQPLQQRLIDFNKLVHDSTVQDNQGRIDLLAELSRLRELNQGLGKEAHALTQALTGGNNKAQGTWGEMVLEKILEASGLINGREYRVQVSGTLAGDEGNKRYQPDVVIDLPDNKQIVIDAKVTLNAYVRYTESTDPEERAREIKAHAAAVRQHIKSLSEKQYQNLYELNALEFVFMFVPVEPAYLGALSADASLSAYAFEHRIMLVCPSTLMATLRIVNSIWQHERQNKKGEEIWAQATKIYDKLVGFIATFDKVGKQIETAQSSFMIAKKQLSEGAGNLTVQVEKLKTLGAKTNKSLPKSRHLEIEEAVDSDDSDSEAEIESMNLGNEPL
ncbi:MAG: DNA recombination protein RmuC [Neisseriaceae bacterium]|nr:DNA recombination protein RmuC [Neisseriaceae bacterium]